MRPSSAVGFKRPTTDYALCQNVGDNPRFKTDNIIALDLDLPERTTIDYEGPSVEPRVQAALEAALSEEQDMSFAAQDNLPTLSGSPALQSRVHHMKRKNSSSSPGKHRPGSRTHSTDSPHRSRKKSQNDEPAEDFPVARGLLRKDSRSK